MPDPSRVTSARQADADGTRAEDDRQLTELLWQHKLDVKPITAAPAEKPAAETVFARMKVWLILLVALPFSLLAYFSTRTAEDDFYA